MSTKGIGKATGKIILMGEHAVVYGEPAIAFPFSGTQVTATVQSAKENSLTSIYHIGLLADVPEELTNIQQLATCLQQKLHTEDFHLVIESTIPSERGMGSSAAVAVAITRAFFDWQKITLSQEELLDYVNFSENIAHGNPSGIDAAATSGEQPIYFRKDHDYLSFPLNIDAYLLVADTGIKGQTRSAVRSVAKLFEKDPDEISVEIKALGRLTEQAKEAIIYNQKSRLGKAMNQAQQHLKNLTVSNEAIDQYIQLALEHHSLGAKLTGGGRGGCLLVLLENKQQAEELASILKDQGIKNTWLQGLGKFAHSVETTANKYEVTLEEA